MKFHYTYIDISTSKEASQHFNEVELSFICEKVIENFMNNSQNVVLSMNGDCSNVDWLLTDKMSVYLHLKYTSMLLGMLAYSETKS